MELNTVIESTSIESDRTVEVGTIVVAVADNGYWFAPYKIVVDTLLNGRTSRIVEYEKARFQRDSVPPVRP